MSTAVKIGKANYSSGNFVKRNWWKLKDGEQAYRILPPLGELAEKGHWSVFHSVHYGYKSMDGKIRAFLSTYKKDFKSGMVLVPDAALERIQKLKAMQDEAKVKGDKATFEKCKNLLQVYNLDNNHYVNAMDINGNIGILKLRHRAMLALKAEIKKLGDEGVDPLSVNDGRFFVFRRTGNGLDTSFQVNVLKEKITVQGLARPVEQDKIHILDQSILNRLGSETAQLDKLFKKFSPEDVARIVKTSDLSTGKSPVIDELFATPKTDTMAAASTSGEEEVDPSIGEDYRQPPSASTSTNTDASNVLDTFPRTSPTMTMDFTPQSTVSAAVQTPVQTQVHVASVAATTSEILAALDDKDFFASLV